MAEKTIKERAKRLFELKDVEVKTRGVEEMLAPLIKQVIDKILLIINLSYTCRYVMPLCQVVLVLKAVVYIHCFYWMEGLKHSVCSWLVYLPIFMIIR